MVPSTSTGQSQLWKLHFVNWGVQGGTDVGRSPESGPVSRSVPVLVLCCRPGRSPGPGRLTPKMGAGNHPGQDAKPTTHRLTLLCVVRWRSPLRRRPAIGRWSPRQLVHLSAVCRDSSDPGSRRRVCTIATRNKTSHRSAPEALRSEVLRLAWTRYSNANHTRLGELLREREGIEIGPNPPKDGVGSAS